MRVSPGSSSPSSSSMEVNAAEPDKQSLPWSIKYGVFDDPETSVEVGEIYQAELPILISKSEYFLLQNNTEAESIHHNFQIGLPIPITWIKSYDMREETKIGMHEEHGHKGQILVPGSRSDNWTEIEEAGLVLALYIVGKNFVEVKKFIGNKKMDDILSFYYGKFRKSDKYQRWCGCRERKSKKCNLGHKIFTKTRQDELLFRLIPNVPEEVQNELLEVSKTFSKNSPEDYFSTLKNLIGLKALVEGLGIGEGKKDLTCRHVDSVKSTEAVLVGPSKIPEGKACAMLEPSEIISFLTGNFRLSKARTDDLFWEAVWPRLRARGWHSEEPRCYNYVPSKNSLVFLVPRVKQFSRNLLKGVQYFDSPFDILNKVASNPELIDLEKNATVIPPREKVPEAFAFGYLDKKKRNRSQEDCLASKPSRHVCRKVEGSGSGGVAGSENKEGAKVVSNGKGSASSNGGFKQ